MFDEIVEWLEKSSKATQELKETLANRSENEEDYKKKMEKYERQTAKELNIPMSDEDIEKVVEIHMKENPHRRRFKEAEKKFWEVLING